ncbi:MAG: signal peptidase I [Lentisphaerales bacterium]|jgi:signal peptidase I|nr:MAG: signal peptidase I [Lentisphaerales bacterium]
MTEAQSPAKPKYTIKRRLIRAAVIIVVAYVFFSRVLLPLRIKGISMEPTYHSGRPNFCFRLRYLFSSPARQDIVLIRLAGGRVAYLKRVIGLPGDTVEFRDGKLFVNDQEVDEPYTTEECDWNMEPVTVRAGNVYVVGDNRAVSIDDHVFGQTSIKRVMGSPIW